MRNKTTEHKPTYFTILPSKAGFTDQLFQFSTFYKLGLTLEYIYRHSTFVNTREGSEEIFDFLQFNEHFSQTSLTSREKPYRRMGVDNCFVREKTPFAFKIRRKIRYWFYYNRYFRHFNFIDIGPGDERPDDVKEGNLESFISLVRETVARKYKSGSGWTNVVRFHLSERGRYFFGELAPLINQQIPYYPDKLDLRSSYIKRRQSHPVPSGFIDGKLKLQVHIRLGDTALIETPWHSYIPLWSGWSLLPLKEYPDTSDVVFGQVMDVGEYAQFLHRFQTFFDENELSIAIFSDGYKTAFHELFKHIDDLQLGDERTQALKKTVTTYEEERFSVFDDVPNCTRRVGENNADLQELVHSSLMADVIIVGCHQRMIPKFLATYYDISLQHPPVVIALYKSRLPRYKEVLGLDARKATIFQIDISDPNYTETLRTVVEAIGRRQEAVLRETPLPV